jgi:uncharacterized protein (DUF305 family)
MDQAKSPSAADDEAVDSEAATADADEAGTPPTPRSRGRRGIAIGIVVVLAVVAAFAIGRLSAPATGTPGTLSVEAGFARDMQVHHQQAVVMSMMVRDETDDPEVRLLAYDIALGQSQGAGELYGLLVEWKLPQSSPEPDMTWMTRPPLTGAGGHDGMGMGAGAGSGASTPASGVTPGGLMPGYATDAQVAKLGTLRGVAAERYYLTLMIAHHQGGIDMAQALLDRSDYPSTAAFARGVVSVQASEIVTMKQMLAARK